MRFVNHSCTPNCRAEKWSVRGQERCGLFTIRPIKAGDEVTIDYQFQYVDCGVSATRFDISRCSRIACSNIDCRPLR
jgi:SET domain-containing protein